MASARYKLQSSTQKRLSEKNVTIAALLVFVTVQVEDMSVVTYREDLLPTRRLQFSSSSLKKKPVLLSMTKPASCPLPIGFGF